MLHTDFRSAYSGCSRSIWIKTASSWLGLYYWRLKQPPAFLSHVCSWTAFLPQQIPERVTKVCAPGIALLVDHRCVGQVDNLLEILDQLFTPRIHKQPQAAIRALEHGIRQADPVAYRRVRPWHAARVRVSATSQVRRDNRVICASRRLQVLPARVAINHQSGAMTREALGELLAGVLCA